MSSETASHSIIQKTENVILNKEVALALFYDVEGLFGKTKIKTICEVLLDRVVTNHLVSGGPHQDSCPSPLLWNSVMDDGLLQRLKESDYYAQVDAGD